MPTRHRWFEITPYFLAFFAGLGLAILALSLIHAILAPWGIGVALTIAVLSVYWGKRLSRRTLASAMIVLWAIAFLIITRAA